MPHGVLVVYLLFLGITMFACGGPNRSDRAMFDAINKGNPDEIKRLVKEGFDINDLVNDKGEHTTPLITSIRTGNLDVVKLLIHEGANVNCRAQSGATPLQVAALSNQPDIVALLQKHGATLALSADFRVTFYSVINLPDYKKVHDLLEGMK